MRSAASLVCLSIALVLASCSSSDPAPGATDGGSSGNANADTGAADAGVDSGDDTDAGSSRGDGGAVSPADFEIVLAKLNCLFQARCGFLAASEEAACEAAVDAARGAPLPYDSEAALAAGRLTFDAGTAVRCLDLTRTKGCFDQVAPSVTCGAVYSPAVDVGGGCQANAECVNGWCDRGTTRHDGCAGTCKAFTPTQGTCGTGLPPCAPSAFCDTTSSHKCVVRGQPGSACDSTSGPFCATGLFCVGTTCKAADGAEGQPCASGFFGSSCAPALYCDDAGACAKRQGSGAACGSYDACNDGLDCVGIVFDPNTGALTAKGACKPYLDQGACDPKIAESGCAGGTACDTTTKACGPVGTLGASCNVGGLYCRQDLYCDGAPGKCRKLVPVGGACTAPAAGSDVSCYPGTQCDATTKTCVLLCK
jgi:hypothetical protein